MAGYWPSACRRWCRAPPGFSQSDAPYRDPIAPGLPRFAGPRIQGPQLCMMTDDDAEDALHLDASLFCLKPLHDLFRSCQVVLRTSTLPPPRCFLPSLFGKPQAGARGLDLHVCGLDSSHPANQRAAVHRSAPIAAGARLPTAGSTARQPRLGGKGNRALARRPKGVQKAAAGQMSRAKA